MTNIVTENKPGIKNELYLQLVTEKTWKTKNVFTFGSR